MSDLRGKIKKIILHHLAGRPFMDAKDVANEITGAVVEAIEKAGVPVKNGMRLYLAKFEFISGENQQPFSCLFYAKSPAALEKKINKYLRGYYGKEGLDEVEGDCYYYLGGQVAVKNCGWEEVINLQQVADHLMA